MERAVAAFRMAQERGMDDATFRQFMRLAVYVAEMRALCWA